MFQKSIKLSAFLLIIAAGKANAQNVAINADGANAAPSAMLDVQSTSKGLLAPRMTKAQRDAINAPAAGLLIYQTNETPGFYYYQESGSWIRLSTTTGSTGGGTTGSGWGLSGNNAAAENFIGTTNYQDLIFKANNIVVGRLNVPGGSGAVLFGENTSGAQNSVALGTGAKANSNNSLALGKGAVASGDAALTMGFGATSTSANHSIVIGTSANSNGEQSIVIGKSAAITGSSQGIAIGTDAKTNTYRSIAIGTGSEVNTNSEGIAFGVNAKASGYQSVAIGSGAQSTKQNSIILGNNTAQVGIGTTSPVEGVKLDVNGNVKIGANGSVVKNIVTGIINGVNVNVSANASTDVEVTLSGNTSGLKASVSVSPSAELPAGVVIAWAKLTTTNKVKIRLINMGTSAVNINSDFYATVTEF